jgi:hypothetical protein
MQSTRTHVLLALAVLAAAGCAKKTSPADESSGAPSATTTAAPAASAAASAVGPGNPSLAETTLADRLAREARNRPPIQPNADDVLAALAKVGAVMPTKRQGLGATYKASFCEGGTTSDGAITVSICEYSDEAAAKAGLEALKDIFPAKGAEHVLHKDTVLTTLRLKEGADVQTQQSKMTAAYKAL